MRVFLCWSGPASHKIALAMHDFLGDVIQELKPFLSTESIRKGDNWRSKIAQQLAETDYGIICLTKDNLDAPWILFEAGALSKNLVTGRVTALLGGILAADVIEPLGQFQHARAEQAEIRKLLQDLNELLPPDKRLETKRLERSFDKFWPGLEGKLVDALKSDETGEDVKPKRSTDDMLAEVLELVRQMKRSTDARGPRFVTWPRANTILSGEQPSLLDLVDPKTFEEVNKALDPETREAIDKAVEVYRSSLPGRHARSVPLSELLMLGILKRARETDTDEGK